MATAPGVEAARLLRLSTRQVRRIPRKVEAGGDAAPAHGPRGKPSSHRHAPALRRKVLNAHRARHPDFGPARARERPAAEGSHVGVETLRRWRLAEGLRERRRHRDPHRSRRPRRCCFGELVRMDASTHGRPEGRGDEAVLTATIDAAAGRPAARFYPAGAVEARMDLLGRWLRTHGRPPALDADRHSIFEPHAKGRPRADPGAGTRFGRARREPGVGLIRAHSPQAKGRVERSLGTAQDRRVGELRLAGARTCGQADAVRERLVPDHDRRLARAASNPTGAHRRLGAGHRPESVPSIRVERAVSNDYVVRRANRSYRLLPPADPGGRGGRVAVERRPGGPTAIRFGKHDLRDREVGATGGREAVPGHAEGAKKKLPRAWRPPADHPWRKRGVS